MQFQDLIFSPNECILYKSTYFGPVAQWIEQLPSKQLVVGSIPARATIFLPLRYFVCIPAKTECSLSLRCRGVFQC